MATIAPTLSRPALQPMAGAASDAALARLVGLGDQRAFELLYQRYRDQLHRYCSSVLRQREDTEEALQATMLNAYRWLAGGVRELQVRPWLYRIAHNECINLLRLRANHEPLSEAAPAAGAEVGERAEIKEGLRQLVSDLDALPLPQRSALVLRELSGLTHDEIGRCLDMPPAVAKQLIYEARQSLQEFGEGRELACVDVRRRISDGDGRVLRARRLGAHLRACSGCREFRSSLRARKRKLAALFPPLPLLAADRILAAILGSGGSGGAAVGGAALIGGGAPAGVAALVLKAAPLGAIALVGGSGVPAALSDAPQRPQRTPPAKSLVITPPAASQPRVAGGLGHVTIEYREPEVLRPFVPPKHRPAVEPPAVAPTPDPGAAAAPGVATEAAAPAPTAPPAGPPPAAAQPASPFQTLIANVLALSGGWTAQAGRSSTTASTSTGWQTPPAPTPTAPSSPAMTWTSVMMDAMKPWMSGSSGGSGGWADPARGWGAPASSPPPTSQPQPPPPSSPTQTAPSQPQPPPATEPQPPPPDEPQPPPATEPQPPPPTEPQPPPTEPQPPPPTEPQPPPPTEPQPPPPASQPQPPPPTGPDPAASDWWTPPASGWWTPPPSGFFDPDAAGWTAPQAPTWP
jgi:RNA polymerase sigma factor (sigma-70 family)